MKTRLSLLIPLILILVAIISSLLVHWQEDRLNKTYIEEQAIRETGLQMAQLQNALYNRLTANDEEEALLSLSLAAMRPGIRNLLLTDSGFRVKLSNRYLNKDELAAIGTGFSSQKAEFAIQNNLSELKFSEKEPAVLQGYYPLTVAYSPDGHNKEVGILYVEQDISERLAFAHRMAIEQSMFFGGVSLFVALLIAIILNRLVSRRVNILVDASVRVASGDYSIQAGLQGRDELGELGNAFDGMALKIQEAASFREQALLDQKRVLQTAVDGFWQTDGEGRFLDVNDAYCQMSGYSREELLQMRIPDVEAKEATPEEVRAHMELIFAKGHDRFESLHRRKDGQLIDVEISTTYWKDQHQFFVFIRDITERKLAERQILSSRGQLEATIKAIPDLLFELGLDGTYHDVHAQEADLLAAPADSLYGKNVYDVLPPDAAESVMAALHEANETGISHGREFELPLPQGKSWFELSVSRKPIIQGEDPRFIVLSREITERKRMEMQARHKEELLNEAEHLGHLGSWELDLLSGELFWSDEIFHLFELDPAEFQPSYENFLNAIHPDDRAKVNQAYTQSLTDKMNYDIVHRLLMRDGRIKWVREHCYSEFDEAGKPLRSVGAVQDITQHKSAEDSLRVSAVAFETHEAIMITDADAKILRVNKAFQDITGYSEEEVLGRNPHMLSSGRQDKAFYDDMWDQLQHNGTWSGEIWDRRKDGSTYPKWLTITAVKNEQSLTTEYVGIFSDISARKQAEEEIRNLAFYDTLTKLPNRRLLQDRFHLALSASARSNHYGAVLFLDLDRFKTINDTMGHAYGDLLLIQVAERLKSCVRESDTVARLGGDEYVILLDSFSDDVMEASQRVAHIAEKIRATICVPCNFNKHECHTSPSIGVCLYRGNAESVDTLLKHADLAMYQAKEAGRNIVRFFDPKMQLAVEKRSALEVDLRRAVPGRQLVLHYQVQIDSNNRPIGAEALVRWLHPQRGMVSPGEFIPVAEESALILEIGDWVMKVACRQIEEWSENEKTRNLIVAVNVSGQQFRQNDFVDKVAAVVRAHRIEPSLLKLELTESVVLSDVAEVVRKMHALKAIGVKLSLDDFGTGYSSLSYLKRLPLDQIKIDQSFVRDIATDPNDAVMVQTIISLAKNFRLNVIAEGVETREQEKFLRDHGCMAYQGYLYSKPVPVEQFEKLLEEMQPA